MCSRKLQNLMKTARQELRLTKGPTPSLHGVTVRVNKETDHSNVDRELQVHRPSRSRVSHCAALSKVSPGLLELLQV